MVIWPCLYRIRVYCRNNGGEDVRMDIQALTEAIVFNAREIAQEIDDCEYVQKDDTESRYTQKQAKVTAYDHIIELIVGRGE